MQILHFSVMINGCPAEYFSSNRGRRQRDFLSLYIFVLVMEFFSIHMDLSVAARKFKPVKRRRDQYVSQLMFVDSFF